MGAVQSLQGEIVDGRYRIDEPVGSGGFGTVYAAWHLLLEKRVAFKVLALPDELSAVDRADRFAMFLEEARFLAKLKHPNIVEALDAGILQSPRLPVPVPYLVLGWCGRGSLSDLVAGRGRLSISETVTLLRPVVSAIAHAHDLGVVHRDLKPSNILFDDHAMTTGPRVIDFGIAKLVMPQVAASEGVTATESMNRAFTYAYAAPEQVAGARTGPWTDVHALALLYVHALTGARPYGDQEPRFAVIDPQRPTPGRAGIDTGPLEIVLERALALRPLDRYRDAREFGEAVDAAAAGQRFAIPAPMPRAVPPPSAPLAPVETTNVSGAPASRTLQTGHQAEIKAGGIAARSRSRPSRRMILAGAGVVAAGALGARALSLGVDALRKGGLSIHATRRPPEEPPGEDDGKGSHDSAARVKRALSTLTLDDLAALARSAGFVLNSSREDESGTRLVEMDKGDDFMASLALFRNLRAPGLETLGHRLLARRMAVAHQAYVFDGIAALLLSATVPTNLAPFDAMIEDLAFQVRGDTEGGGDPAGEAVSTTVTPWEAEGIATLSAEELASRVRRAGNNVTNGPFGDDGFMPLTFHISRDGDLGQIELFRSDGVQALAERRRARMRLTFVRSGDALLAISGPGALTSPDLLAEIVKGLPGRVEVEPPR
ncbi:MAG: serine/threonine protein kinase [Myxococcales bacterium]|nr:serine/threonine protein kinase [Myxococcales bacterium]